MATLAAIAVNVLEKLEFESGSSEWWTDTEVKADINDLYRTICKEGEILKTRDSSVVTVEDQQDYDYPSAYEVISLIGLDYDGKPLFPSTIEELQAYSRTWRSMGSSVPAWYFFEDGNEFTGPSLFPKPATADLELGMRFSYQASVLEDADEPEQLFKNGLILEKGVISIELAKEGEGQNIERAEWYWQQFITEISFPAKKSKLPGRFHVLRSIEDGSIVQGLGRGPRLPSAYPEYRF